MNQVIVDNLKKLVNLIQLETNNLTDNKQILTNKFRISSMKKVIKLISAITFKINSIDQIENIKGIGKNSLQRIDEIIKTGKLSETKNYDKLIKEYGGEEKIIDDLMKVIGIGRTIAKELINTYKIKSVEELKILSDTGKIELNEKIKLGLKYVGKFEGAIPRIETDKVYNYLQKLTDEYDNSMFVTFCGSYRRKLKTSSDFDMMLCSTKIIQLEDIKEGILSNYIHFLHEKEFLLDDITDKNIITKYMGFCRLNIKKPVRRIDIRLIPIISYFSALLYFTGSNLFNQNMRLVAKKKGYKLNEYGLFDGNNNMILVNSEQEIFEILEMNYVAPENR